ncbi:sensor histidine kinase [Microbispora hainanensis]|uniref:histidine kinase n=1 Tax=Microbispora hainanensis TaxID=568844 RepID=A0A544YPY9_9ACTN|nr:histidine kinase [Microbispora hainanensis]TQS18824.1 sensor histidine kinase [Microbispora hainanensis]
MNVARALRILTALVIGTLTAVVELAFLLVAAPLALLCLPHPAARRAGERLLRAVAVPLARLEMRRLGLLGGLDHAVGTGRVAGYLAARWPIGLLGGLVLLLLVIGVSVCVYMVWSWAHGENPDGIPPTPGILVYFGVAGLVLLFLDIMGIQGVAALELRVARRFLGPSPTELLERRIDELARTRAGIVSAVDQERRRIERDLHDGVQQRLVALAVLIGRARRGRSPQLLDDLLHQAHEEAQEALRELREVAWRVYPAELDTLGLRESLSAVAERAGMPVTVAYGLTARPPGEVETAVYFVVREAVTNAAKHAAAEQVRVEILEDGDTIVVRVRDDGRGGADPGGGGLSGLARRVAALDGRFQVDSPPGGPTTVSAELPRE